MTRWLLGLAVVACSASPQTRTTSLRDAVTDYAHALRWGQIERAAIYVPAKSREAFLQQKRRSQGLVQIHEYDVRTVDYVAGADKARIVVLAVWTLPTDPVTHQELLEQTWQFSTGWELVAQKAVQQAEVKAAPGDAL
jgi:hypothetical protein